MSSNTSTFTPHKSELLNILRDIAQEYGRIGDAYRQKAFTEASWAIQDYIGNIFTDYNTVKIHKIGKSTKEVIQDYLEDGQVKRLLELRGVEPHNSSSYPSDTQDEVKSNIIELFKGIYGVGPITATELYNKGCRKLEDTWPYLTPIQKLGCQWYYHLQERINRPEADAIIQVISQEFSKVNSTQVWMACGSYRRGKSDMGDLDILIQKTDSFVLNHFVNALTKAGLIVGHLAVGQVKYLGLCRLNNNCNVHRIDLMIVDPISWPYATLYFTGSQDLNVKMRDRAIEMGLRLNEYRLTDSDGNRYPAHTEADIFNHLNMNYLEPTERSI